MSLYRKILAQAWKNTWTNKYLWLFGLFATLLSSSGELNLLFRGFGDVPEQGLFPGLRGLWSTGLFSATTASNFGKIMITDSFSLMMALTILVIGFMMFCLIVWFSTISQAGLVYNYSRIISNKSHDLKSGIDVGIKNFWPVFTFNLLLKAIVYVIFLIVAAPIVLWFVNQSFFQNVFFFFAYIIFIPASIVVAFIAKYAICYAVIKGEKIREALILGWELFLKNWLVSLEMAFILFGVSFLATLCFILCSAAFAIIFLFISFLLSLLINIVNVNLILYCSLIIFIFLIVLVGSILSTFMISSWTGLFVELLNKGGVSKIVRIFDKK